MLQYENNHSLSAMVIFCGADNYVSYSERYHLACCGVSSLNVSSTQRAKNSPPDCFLDALSNPVMLQYKNNHSLSAMVISVELITMFHIAKGITSLVAA